eukprot:587905-Pleurochrysis_carterae.AAC.1
MRRCERRCEHNVDCEATSASTACTRVHFQLGRRSHDPTVNGLSLSTLLCACLVQGPRRRRLGTVKADLARLALMFDRPATATGLAAFDIGQVSH